MKSILFLCPHGAAKSVLAAAYFQHLAEQRGVPFQATSAGTEPDPVVHPAVIAALRSEGLPIPEHAPRLVTDVELKSVFRVVSLGCDLSGRVRPETLLNWNDVPLLSDNFSAAQKSILAHVEQLVAELAALR